MHPFAGIDYWLLQQATAFTFSSPTWQVVVYLCAEVLIFIYPLVLYVLWRFPHLKSELHGGQKAVILAVMSFVAALAIKSLIAFLYIRPRPFVTHPDLMVLDIHVDQGSFPSAHAMIAFAISSSIFLSGYRRLGSVLLVVALVVALGRVFAGVHYPTDVVGGAVLGIGAAWYLHREASTLKKYLPNHI